MRHALLAAAALCGTIVLAGCATDNAYGPPYGYGDVDYGGYYDGYYGPFAGGYWGPSGLFYYLDRSTGRYHSDTGRHFRRDGGPGFNPIQGHAPSSTGGQHQGRRRPGRDGAPGPRPGPGPDQGPDGGPRR